MHNRNVYLQNAGSIIVYVQVLFELCGSQNALKTWYLLPHPLRDISLCISHKPARGVGYPQAEVRGSFAVHVFMS